MADSLIAADILKMKMAARWDAHRHQHKKRGLLMNEKFFSRTMMERQYSSPLAHDLETCAIYLADLAGRVGREEWQLISAIRQQILAVADVTEGLLIPDQVEV